MSLDLLLVWIWTKHSQIGELKVQHVEMDNENFIIEMAVLDIIP